MMPDIDLGERLLDSWIGLNGLLKDSKMTEKLTYNEAVVMRIVFRDYQREPAGSTSVQNIIKQTNMLKSLVNRTVDSLCRQGYLVKEKDESDRRSLNVRLVPDKIGDFLEVHERSMLIAHEIIKKIGEEDAEAFIRCCGKLLSSQIKL